MLIFRLALTVVVLGCGSAQGEVEQRCKELGANCACSETLDTTRYTSDGTNFDPSNSTAKQCGNRGDFILAGGTGNRAYLSNEDEIGMPPGNTVDKVWRFDWPPNRVGHGAGAYGSVTKSTRRVCNRFYTKFSSDFNGWTQCNDKYGDFTWSGCEAQLADLGRITLTNYACLSAMVDRQNNYPSSGGVTRADCVENWCRIEQCVAGNVSAGTNLTSSLSVTQVGVSDAKHFETGAIFVGDAPGAFDVEQRAMMLTGSRGRRRLVHRPPRVLHFMQATSNTDAGQSIGRAYEVELR